MANKNWNNTMYSRRRRPPAKYDSATTRLFVDYIHDADSRGMYSDFDFNKASVGGRYLKYGVENYGY